MKYNIILERECKIFELSNVRVKKNISRRIKEEMKVGFSWKNKFPCIDVRMENIL